MDLRAQLYNEIAGYIKQVEANLPQLDLDLELVANAAEGRLQLATPADKQVVAQAIQRIIETLIYDPYQTGRAENLELPLGFWEKSTLGRALMQALIWVKKERLLTQTEAARIFGKSLQTINQAIRDGRLTKYIDFEATNPQQGRILVNIDELTQLYEEA